MWLSLKFMWDLVTILADKLEKIRENSFLAAKPP